MSDLVHVTINGKQVQVQKGTLLVEAARQIGIEIPVFCYHKKLKPVGACRMCLVEIERLPRLQTACTTPATEGMVCNSVSQNAISGQNAVIELLLANHPLDCPVCDKGGECPLQDNTFRYGLGSSRMQEDKRAKNKAYQLSDKIVLDRERCIMCYRCTRFQAEIPGDFALVALERGGESEIGTLDGESFDSPFSGNTIELCPVGALTSRFYRFRSRPWDIQRTASVCSGCSVGCNVSLQARDGALLRVLARENPAIDDGWLCDKGRFETLPPLTHPAHAEGPAEAKRPVRPLVRKAGALVPVTWDEALHRACELMRGKSAIVASAQLSNEAAATLAQHLVPALPDASAAFSPDVVSPWPVQGAIQNLRSCTKIVNVGIDPWNDLPVLALWERKPLEKGAAIVAIGAKNGLWRDTVAWIEADPKQLATKLRGLLSALGGTASDAATTLAAAKLQREGPAAVLVGASVALDPQVASLCKQLAEKLGANAETGFVGAPAVGTNARGIMEHAKALAGSGSMPTSVPAGTQTALLIGPSTVALPVGTKRIVASWTTFADFEAVEVVLPLCHPYEQAGTFTNLEGKTQELRAGAFAPKDALPDWALLGMLVNALGGNVRVDLPARTPVSQLPIRPALSPR